MIRKRWPIAPFMWIDRYYGYRNAILSMTNIISWDYSILILSETDCILPEGKKKGKKAISFDTLACEHHEVGDYRFFLFTVNSK